MTTINQRRTYILQCALLITCLAWSAAAVEVGKGILSDPGVPAQLNDNNSPQTIGMIDNSEGKHEEDLLFWPAFMNSMTMIFATEIGDKTFFIAAVLSMKNARLAVFSGAFMALVCMTILSVIMGMVLPNLLPRKYTQILSVILFLYFGVKMVWDSFGMTHKVSEELEEVEEMLGEDQKKKNESSVMDDVEAGNISSGRASSNNSQPDFSATFVKSLTLTFLAEWGDRSQIATIALSSHLNPYGVTVGGCLGHFVCTGMACLGGRYLASKISEKTVSFYSGIIFIGFAIVGIFFDL